MANSARWNFAQLHAQNSPTVGDANTIIQHAWKTVLGLGFVGRLAQHSGRQDCQRSAQIGRRCALIPKRQIKSISQEAVPVLFDSSCNAVSVRCNSCRHSLSIPRGLPSPALAEERLSTLSRSSGTNAMDCASNSIAPDRMVNSIAADARRLLSAVGFFCCPIVPGEV